MAPFVAISSVGSSEKVLVRRVMLTGILFDCSKSSDFVPLTLPVCQSPSGDVCLRPSPSEFVITRVIQDLIELIPVQ